MSIHAINNSCASLTNIIWDPTNRGVQAAIQPTILNSLQADIGAIPFGNKKVWRTMQQGDIDCKTVIELKSTGNVPNKRVKNRIVNTLLKECQVNNLGLLVVRTFDTTILKEVERIVVPQSFLHSVLTLLHLKLMHPSSHQLSRVFGKYFFAPNTTKAIDEIKSSCDICVRTAKLPDNLINFTPNVMPSHPGSHMNIDIICRSSQKIMVCTDMFSSFTTATKKDLPNLFPNL